MIKCITHEDEKLYHSRSKSGEMLSSHLLGLFNRSPWKYYQTIKGNIKDAEIPAYEFGRAAHKLILEGAGAFNEAYTVSDGPVNPKTGSPFGTMTKAYQDWLLDQTGEIISHKDYDIIAKMNNSCLEHESISELLKNGESECVVRARVEDVDCQIRIDYFNEEYGIIDLKTCRDIEFFEKDCRDFGYCYQLAFYQDVLYHATGVKFPVHIIAVDKTEFNIAGRWDITDRDLEQCTKINHAGIARLKECRKNHVWPTGYERTRIFSLHKE